VVAAEVSSFPMPLRSCVTATPSRVPPGREATAFCPGVVRGAHLRALRRIQLRYCIIAREGT
jgi:hypothetical protein